MIEAGGTGSLQEETTPERFRVSYPFPIALALIVWVGTWFLLAEVLRHGGLQACGIPTAATSLMAWVIYLINAFAGPVSVVAYSASLEVDGDRLLWKRWFGLSSLGFDRADIREARVERTRSSRRMRISLATGRTIRFTQFASGFTKLGHYLGVDPEVR